MTDQTAINMEVSRWQGNVEARLEALEKLGESIDKKLDGISKRVSMAQGGWIAIMAVVGMIASGVGIVVGFFKLISGKGGA